MADISIVVPFYKVPYEYMHECLKSIINQTYRNNMLLTMFDEKRLLQEEGING